MPIRHCQKCGLKVLIDDSQSAVNPFYCQRCTAAMKDSGDAAPAAAGAASATRSGGTAVRRASASGAGKSATIKVLCPYCKASFNGRIPQKPARGACPVCQKELILLPTGDIRASAGFDAAKWQAEQTAASPAKETGTKTLVKKYAAEQPAAASDPGTRVLTSPPPAPDPIVVPPEPAPPAEPEPAMGGGSLPSWLDDSPAAPSPQPAAETEPEIEAAPTAGSGDAGFGGPAELPNWLDDSPAPAAPDPEPAAAPSDPGAYDPTIRIQPEEEPPAPARTPPPPPKAPPRKKAAVAPPPPPPEPEPEPAPSARGPKAGTSRRTAPGRRATGRHAGAYAGAGATGLGTVLLAYFLLVTPLVACPFLLKQKDSFKETALDKLGARFQRGFGKIYDKWFAPRAAAPAPPPAAPKPAKKAPVQPTAEDKERDKQSINDAWIKFRRMNQTFKQRSVGATPEEKAEFKKAEDEVNALRQNYDALRKRYRDVYKEDYDPTKE